MAYPYAARLRPLREEVECALEIGEGLTLRAARSRLAGLQLTADEQSELNIIDEMIIASLLALDNVADYLLVDDKTQPLANWWWHLSKLRTKTYPDKLLPPHLQVIYTETADNKKVA